MQATAAEWSSEHDHLSRSYKEDDGCQKEGKKRTDCTGRPLILELDKVTLPIFSIRQQTPEHGCVKRSA